MPTALTPEDETLLLALLNSTPVLDGQPVDELADDEGAGGWATRHGGTGTVTEVRNLRRVRETLQAVVHGHRPPSALGPSLEGVRMAPEVSDDGVRWELDVEPARRLTSRAVLAWAATQEQAPGRLRPCANPDCRLFLLDRSRANTARWCSMAACGNRMKARRHYRRGQNTG